jgi:cobalt-zinc-cadmium efflux system outer membrane protein
MNRLLLIIFTAAIFPGWSYGQNGFSTFLETIKTNNQSLRAAAKYAAAEFARVRTGLTPADPTVDYGHFPGTGTAIGTKTTINASVSLVFPTVYLHKRAVSRSAADKIAKEYKSDEQGILVSAAQLYMQMIYLNKSSAELQNRAEDVEAMELLVERKKQAGDANLIELQKARMEALIIHAC